ncbi:23S rRNA (pseudouridine(1915)-N(3))-methyltransferase RlmH [Campylobacter avium]|uniref:23S rRNA (pseudouridine(1915)-N(3))-methyltransferase RlmH n=1 Tax=Campylobacter avium TaxID=522485 RepID=UPI001DC34631|nr:23S rRNA (pseudouridine(1915)-N(3))-methyltransferase RlmH [Campylobacter avium]HJE66128.1 23S rRNA (pseudouridine(1915)-N(3))-methyltransferase RlmH [Campylobacter avium]
MQIYINCIQKSSDFKEQEQRYLKLISIHSKIKDAVFFNDKIAKAQKTSKQEAKKSYEECFKPLKKGFCIALDEKAKELDSFEFAKLLESKNEVSFFIAGAYGFSENFIKSCDFALSLSKLTLAHSIAKVLLLEQIYRAFCIIKKHPYHK